MHNVARLAAVIGTALVGLVLTGCTIGIDPVPTDAASPTAATTAPPPPTAASGPCQDAFSSELRWDPERDVPVTATVRLTNEGDAPCDLTGFPGGVDFLADGHPLTVSYELGEQADDFGRAGTTVTVEPGASAYVWLWVDRAEPQAGSPVCEFPATATDLTVTLPDATAPLTMPAPIQACTDELMLRYGPVDSEPRAAALGF